MTSDHYTSVRTRTDDFSSYLTPTASLISDTHANRDAIHTSRHSNYTRSLIIANDPSSSVAVTQYTRMRSLIPTQP